MKYSEEEKVDLCCLSLGHFELVVWKWQMLPTIKYGVPFRGDEKVLKLE